MSRKAHDPSSVHPGIRSECNQLPLREVARIILGLSTGRLPEGPDELPFIHVKHITEAGVTALSEIKDIRSTKLNPSWEKFRTRDGDVLLTAKGSVLKAGVVGPDSAGAITTSNLILIRPNPEFLLPGILVEILQTPLIEKQLLNMSRSMTMPVSITIKDVGELKVPIPSMSSQRQLQEVRVEFEHYSKLASHALEQRRAIVKELLAQTLWSNATPKSQRKVSE